MNIPKRNDLMSNETRAAARPSQPAPNQESRSKNDTFRQLQQQQMDKAYAFAEIAARGVRSFDKDRSSKSTEAA